MFSMNSFSITAADKDSNKNEVHVALIILINLSEKKDGQCYKNYCELL